MRKTVVLHLIKSLGRGGAEMLLPETIRVHDTDRFEFHCIYFLPWKNQMVEALESLNTRVTCMPATNNVAILMSAGKVSNYCKEHSIDLIHAHLPWAGLTGRRVFRSTGIPLIYTEHNKQERYHLGTRVLNRLSFNSQSAAVAVSQDVADSIQKYIHPRIPVETILNGVNTSKFKRDIAAGEKVRVQLGIPANACVVGTAAVFRFQKRLTEWLDVFATAAEKNPLLYGIIVGDGPLREEIVEHRRKIGLESRVFMPGLQTDVLPWMSAMDIYMMTSVFEGLPVAMLEAMSMECAIISTDAGGIPEVIVNERSGKLVKVDQYAKLSDILMQLSVDKDAIRMLGTGARERAEQSFSIQSMASKLEDLYLRTLSKKV